MNQSSSERTEKATPKKRREAREKGQVRKSNEVNLAFSLLITFVTLKMFSSYYVANMTNLIKKFFSGDVFSQVLTAPYAMKILSEAIMMMAIVIAPMLFIAMIGGVLINIVQTGFLFSTKALQPKFSRLNPLQGLKRILSMKTLFELIKSIAKLIIIAIIVYNQIFALMNDFTKTIRGSLAASAGYMFGLIIDTGITLGGALLILAIFDYAYQWWQYEKDLKMTKHEVKMEYKQMEGDPEIKGKIKQKQRQMAMMRMMQGVPDADVVITNPTHYAIALKYDEAVSGAPMVIAKGKDYLAQKIKDIAKENKIEIVEDKPLAQSLYSLCEVGSEIPMELYQAVAEILAQIYKMKNRTGAHR